jgi:uncharacterized protein (DUF2147 family)
MIRDVLRSAAFGAMLATALGVAGNAQASDSPVGLWKTIDDETKKPRALVRITEAGGVLTGKIEKLFDPSTPNPVCEACTDDRKGKPIIGMTILSGLQKFPEEWGEGRILDPNNGKVYKAKARLFDGGGKLEVRGFMGVSLLGRSQTWIREQ